MTDENENEIDGKSMELLEKMAQVETRRMEHAEVQFEADRLRVELLSKEIARADDGTHYPIAQWEFDCENSRKSREYNRQLNRFSVRDRFALCIVEGMALAGKSPEDFIEQVYPWADKLMQGYKTGELK